MCGVCVCFVLCGFFVWFGFVLFHVCLFVVFGGGCCLPDFNTMKVLKIMNSSYLTLNFWKNCFSTDSV